MTPEGCSKLWHHLLMTLDTSFTIVICLQYKSLVAAATAELEPFTLLSLGEHFTTVVQLLCLSVSSYAPQICYMHNYLSFCLCIFQPVQSFFCPPVCLYFCPFLQLIAFFPTFVSLFVCLYFWLLTFFLISVCLRAYLFLIQSDCQSLSLSNNISIYVSFCTSCVLQVSGKPEDRQANI